MKSSLDEKNRILHYGWWVVTGGFASQLILMACLQTLPLTLSQIEATLKIPHAAAGAIIATFGACYALFSLFWGFMADRFGPRKAITLASLVACISLFLFGTQVKHLTQALIIAACMGFGAAGLYAATIPKLVGAWFIAAKRGRAMSLVTPGGTIAGVILGLSVPFLSALYGWQQTFVILSAAVFAIALYIYSIVRNNPTEKGLTPYGSSADAPPQKAAESANLAAFGAVLKKKITWHLAAMFVCWQGPYMIVTSFTALSMVSAGLSVAQSGIGIIIYKGCAFCGQQIWGPLSDKMERKVIFSIACFGWVLSAVFYAMVWGQGLYIMYFAVGCIGFCVGCVPVLLALLSDYYEPEYRGTGNGVISTTGFIGGFFGPLLAGVIADAYGMPRAFLFAAATMCCTAIIALTLPRLRVSRAMQENNHTV